jgi:hypothetical protein
MKKLVITLGILLLPGVVNAGLIDDGTWAGWSVLATEDQEGNFNYVDPGYGGQRFDAEYLLYKLEGNILSIGLQTGFDIVDGHQLYGGKNYWAGDIALSFDGVVLGSAGTYEYALDFGLGQCGWSNNGNADCGQLNEEGLNNSAGVYAVTSWNNNVYSGHHQSDPFAMISASATYDLLSNDAGQIADHYYRQMSFDLSALGLTAIDGFDAHWTMSCGNDAIDGSVSVPEPSSMLLLALGLIGLSMSRRRV